MIEQRPLTPDELVELAGLYLQEYDGDMDQARIKMIREVRDSFEQSGQRLGLKGANTMAASYVQQAASNFTS